MKHIDVLDLSDDARDLIRECEAKGEQTVFERYGRAVAMLVSYDEYLALRETIEIANDSLFFATLAERDSREPEPTNRRLHFVCEEDFKTLSAEERDEAEKAFARIEDDPIAGAPLFEPLKGLWSYRAGKLRIVYKIVAEARMVVILVIRSAA